MVNIVEWERATSLAAIATEAVAKIQMEKIGLKHEIYMEEDIMRKLNMSNGLTQSISSQALLEVPKDGVNDTTQLISYDRIIISMLSLVQ